MKIASFLIALATASSFGASATREIGYCGTEFQQKTDAEKAIYEKAPTPNGIPSPPDEWTTGTDGKPVPWSYWLPSAKPRAIVVACPGLDMACSEFDVLGEALSARGIAVFSVDMRGQGYEQSNFRRGTFAPWKTWIADVRVVIERLRKRYPETPLFLSGQSTGDCVALCVAAEMKHPPAGIILHSMPLIFLYPKAVIRKWVNVLGAIPIGSQLRFVSTKLGLTQGSLSFANDSDGTTKEWLDSPLRTKLSLGFIKGCFKLGVSSREGLGSITSPVLVHLGCKDTLATAIDDPQTRVEEFEKAFTQSPSVKTIKWPDYGHLLLRGRAGRSAVAKTDLEWIDQVLNQSR